VIGATWHPLARAAVLAAVLLAALAACAETEPARRATLRLPLPTMAERVRPRLPIEPGFARAIAYLGGTVVHPRDYEPTVAGFQAYLDATGVTHFTAVELTTPHHPEIAARFGHEALLPQREWWPRGAALALLAEELRRVVGTPIVVRGWWRPHAYNEAVEGDPAGDHPTAHAFDIDYDSPGSRYLAELRLLQLFREVPWLDLSLGLGNMTTHVGIQSPLGCRVWYYRGHPGHDDGILDIQPSPLTCHGNGPA